MGGYIIQPLEHPDEVKPTSIQQEALAIQQRLLKEFLHSSDQQEAPSQPQEPFGAETSSALEEAQIQPSGYLKEINPT